MEDEGDPPNVSLVALESISADINQDAGSCTVQAQRVMSEEADKIASILAACDKDEDIGHLVALASSEYGLVNDQVRRKAWPILLGCHTITPYGGQASRDWKGLPRHKDEDQVALDVNRSFVYYPQDETEQQIDGRKQELSDLITQVLREHPMLCYFQGYHDIVQVLLLVLGAECAPAAVSHLSLLRVRDFMLPSLSPSLAHLRLLPLILQTVDPNLCQHLSSTQPLFALSATLTLYAHDVQGYGDIVRLFDFLIAQPAVASIYLFAVIVLSRREELFEISPDEPEMLHFTLSKLPKPLDLEALISRTLQTFQKHPPESLPKLTWWKVSAYSVLKTTRWPQRNQTIRDGERLFARSATQLRRDQYRKQVITVCWKHRRSLGQMALAVFIAVTAYWMRKQSIVALPENRILRGIRYFWISNHFHAA